MAATSILLAQEGTQETSRMQSTFIASTIAPGPCLAGAEPVEEHGSIDLSGRLTDGPIVEKPPPRLLFDPPSCVPTHYERCSEVFIHAATAIFWL